MPNVYDWAAEHLSGPELYNHEDGDMTQPLPGQLPLPNFPPPPPLGDLEGDLEMDALKVDLERDDAYQPDDGTEFFMSEPNLLRTRSIPDRGPAYDRIVAEAKNLFMLRNSEYGDSIVRGGVLGAVYELIGVSDRLRQVLLFGDEMREERLIEIIDDKARDGINYAVIVLMLLEEGNLYGK